MKLKLNKILLKTEGGSSAPTTDVAPATPLVLLVLFHPAASGRLGALTGFICTWLRMCPIVQNWAPSMEGPLTTSTFTARWQMWPPPNPFYICGTSVQAGMVAVVSIKSLQIMTWQLVSSEYVVTVAAVSRVWGRGVANRICSSLHQDCNGFWSDPPPESSVDKKLGRGSSFGWCFGHWILLFAYETRLEVGDEELLSWLPWQRFKVWTRTELDEGDSCKSNK